MANSPVRRLRRMFDEFGAVDGVLYLLSRLAGATGGLYLPVQTGNEDIERFLEFLELF